MFPAGKCPARPCAQAAVTRCHRPRALGQQKHIFSPGPGLEVQDPGVMGGWFLLRLVGHLSSCPHVVTSLCPSVSSLPLRGDTHHIKLQPSVVTPFHLPHCLFRGLVSRCGHVPGASVCKSGEGADRSQHYMFAFLIAWNVKTEK